MNKNNLNKLGFSGVKNYNLRYVLRTRNFKYSWPHNNIFNRAKDENDLLENILKQNVGVKLKYSYDDYTFKNLKLILKQFLLRHIRTNYKLLFKKSQKQGKKNVKINSKSIQICRREVKTYIHKLILYVIPFKLFGSKQNRIVFERNLRKVLRTGKLQVFSLNTVMLNISSKQCQYLKSIDGHMYKTNLLSKIFIWLIKAYILAALKCIFYITESNYSNKYVFYDKCKWNSLEDKYFNNIKKKLIGTYPNYLVRECLISSVNMYILKLLPKRRGIRPIYMGWKTNDRTKSKLLTYRLIKEMLLKFANAHYSTLYSTSKVFHNSLLNFYFTWCSLRKPKIYYVRADFIDAFGSIIHQKLIVILRKIQKENLSISLFENYNLSYKISTKDAFNILENYITNFKFKNNKYVYRLSEGLSQGGSLSSLLCNLYFGDIDQRYLREFIDDKFGLFVRNCDDYLYLTLRKNKAISFLELLEKGFLDYNLRINYSKTKSNLRGESNIVSFLSFRMNVESFQLCRCYKSYRGISAYNTFSLRNPSSPGLLLLGRLTNILYLKFHAIYLDSTYNSNETLITNVYFISNLTAARYYSLIHSLFFFYNENFIFNCIMKFSGCIIGVVMKNISNNDVINRQLLKWAILKSFVIKFEKVENESFKNIARRMRGVLHKLTINFSSNQMDLINILNKIKQPKIFRSLM